MNELNRYCPVCRGVMIDDQDYPDRAVYRCVRCHRRFTFSMFTKLDSLKKFGPPGPHKPPVQPPKPPRPLLKFAVVFLIVFLGFFVLAILL